MTTPSKPSYSCWILCGGTASFETFLRILASNTPFHKFDSIPAIPFDQLEHALLFLLPEYDKGEDLIEELPFETAELILQCVERGSTLFMENYLAQDYFHKQISALQILGGKRSFHQEYLEYNDTLLQARSSFYLPAVPADALIKVSVSNCTGTHRIFREGTYRYPVLVKHKQRKIFGSAMDLTRMDVHYMRPYFRWCGFYAELFSEICSLPEESVRKAFREVFSDFAHCGTTQDARTCVEKAIRWHWDSKLMRDGSGSRGIFEMIRSNDLGVRANLRTDSTLLTASLFAAAGKLLHRNDLTQAGCNLADFLLKRNIQSPEGYFRWFDHNTMVYFSDCSRAALSMINLYKSTGLERYFQCARKAADALLKALTADGLGCGYFDLQDGFANRSGNDNPVFYGEMVSFLLQMKQEKYTRAALKIIERISEKFPHVSPFGFSDNFTYSRYLLMLSCAQRSTDCDFSGKIAPILDFFFQHQCPAGGITETPIRLEKHTEAGVGIGDGSDCIADILYCNNFCFNALSVLVKLPPEKQSSLPMEKIRHSYEKLRNFFLRTQLSSPDGRFNGAWMRAYDMDHEEYFGLNKDMDWGSYCIMAGWVMTFVPAVLLFEDVENESYFFR